MVMRAIQVSRFGGVDELDLVDVPTPTAGPGEVLLKLDYAGVNFIDVYMRSGLYAKNPVYKTPLPMTIGMEGVGTVAALGKEVSELDVGCRVGYCLARGSYAEYAVVPAWRLVKIPESVSSPIAVALMLQGLTAHYLVNSAFALKPKQTCVIHAGAGGVGQILIQLAKLKGAIVITTVGSREKADIASTRGADHVVLYRDTDFREAVMDVTHGRGADVIYDSVGKDTIQRSLRCLKRQGVCVMYGTSSGPVQCIEPSELADAGSIFFTRPNLADYTANQEEIAMRSADLFRSYCEHQLVVCIDRELPLSEARTAHQLLEARRSKGKLLLRIRA